MLPSGKVGKNFDVTIQTSQIGKTVVISCSFEHLAYLHYLPDCNLLTLSVLKTWIYIISGGYISEESDKYYCTF